MQKQIVLNAEQLLANINKGKNDHKTKLKPNIKYLSANFNYVNNQETAINNKYEDLVNNAIKKFKKKNVIDIKKLNILRKKANNFLFKDKENNVSSYLTTTSIASPLKSKFIKNTISSNNLEKEVLINPFSGSSSINNSAMDRQKENNLKFKINLDSLNKASKLKIEEYIVPKLNDKTFANNINPQISSRSLASDKNDNRKIISNNESKEYKQNNFLDQIEQDIKIRKKFRRYSSLTSEYTASHKYKIIDDLNKKKFINNVLMSSKSMKKQIDDKESSSFNNTLLKTPILSNNKHKTITRNSNFVTPEKKNFEFNEIHRNAYPKFYTSIINQNSLILLSQRNKSYGNLKKNIEKLDFKFDENNNNYYAIDSNNNKIDNNNEEIKIVKRDSNLMSFKEKQRKYSRFIIDKYINLKAVQEQHTNKEDNENNLQVFDKSNLENQRINSLNKDLRMKSYHFNQSLRDKLIKSLEMRSSSSRENLQKLVPEFFRVKEKNNQEKELNKLIYNDNSCSITNYSIEKSNVSLNQTLNKSNGDKSFSSIDEEISNNLVHNKINLNKENQRKMRIYELADKLNISNKFKNNCKISLLKKTQSTLDDSIRKKFLSKGAKRIMKVNKIPNKSKLENINSILTFESRLKTIDESMKSKLALKTAINKINHVKPKQYVSNYIFSGENKNNNIPNYLSTIGNNQYNSKSVNFNSLGQNTKNILPDTMNKKLNYIEFLQTEREASLKKLLNKVTYVDNLETNPTFSQYFKESTISKKKSKIEFYRNSSLNYLRSSLRSNISSQMKITDDSRRRFTENNVTIESKNKIISSKSNKRVQENENLYNEVESSSELSEENDENTEDLKDKQISLYDKIDNNKIIRKKIRNLELKFTII